MGHRDVFNTNTHEERERGEGERERGGEGGREEEVCVQRMFSWLYIHIQTYVSVVA